MAFEQSGELDMTWTRLAQATIGMVATALVALASPARAQTYPERTVRIIVPTSAGGSIDATARVIANKLSEKWGKPVIIENRPGAGMRIGVDAAAKSPADGYTLVIAHDGAFALNPLFYPDLPYDSQKNFTPVAMLVSIPDVIMINASVPAKSVKELIDLAKRDPGKLNHATGGPGGLIALELFKSMANVDIVSVQYRGAAPSVAGMLSGQVQICMTDLASAQAGMQSDRVRTLAVTSLKRAKRFPNLPTADETGLPGYNIGVWIGMFAPAGTPANVVRTIEAGVKDALAMPDVREKLEGMGAELRSGSAEELRASLANDLQRYGKLIKERNIKIGQ
jgi:tripartite-type tricarboxylate transporter receptor subunit TctC